MLKKARSLFSGYRCLSEKVEGDGTTQLGIYKKAGEDIGVVNRYFVQFKNGGAIPLIEMMDNSSILEFIFRSAILEMNKDVDALLNKEGYITDWNG